MGVESCYGCGVESPRHPVGGIGKALRLGKPIGPFRVFPICLECYHHPPNRKRVLKMHFFPRHQAERALASAGSASISG